jgi:hypothetical protein
MIIIASGFTVGEAHRCGDNPKMRAQTWLQPHPHPYFGNEGLGFRASSTTGLSPMGQRYGARELCSFCRHRTPWAN